MYGWRIGSVWRVEDEDHNGPYQGYGMFPHHNQSQDHPAILVEKWQGESVYGGLDIERQRIKAYLCPALSDDNQRSPHVSLLCGFSSLTAFFDWFGPEEREMLNEAGLQLVRYDGVAFVVSESGRQCVFLQVVNPVGFEEACLFEPAVRYPILVGV
jgi:hypothetical protein